MLPIGIYEKALPYSGTWRERLAMAHEAGFDFVEMSVDESRRAPCPSGLVCE